MPSPNITDSNTPKPATKKTAAKKKRTRKPKEPTRYMVEITNDQLNNIESVVNGVDELLYSMGALPYSFGTQPSKQTPVQKMMADLTTFIGNAQNALSRQDELKDGWIHRRLEEQIKQAFDAINQVLNPPKKLDNDADKQAALEHAKSCLNTISELLG